MPDSKLSYPYIPVLAFIFTLLSFPLKAQFYNLPNDYSFSLLTEKQLAAKDSAIHTGMKPYIPFFSRKYVHVADTTPVFKYITDDPVLDLIFRKHFLRVEPKKEKFVLHIDPLLNLEIGRDAQNPKKNLYTNTRGAIASGTIGDKFYFETLFAENQSFFPTYLYNYGQLSSVVPGQGRWKTFKTGGYDYSFSSGFISMQPLKNLNIQLGHGKQKIGNGYRSLLLSDNSFNYPYARITQQWFKGRVQYTNIYAVFMNLVSATAYVDPNVERLFQKKATSFQYLSVNVTKSFNLGFFQGLIWQAGDTHNRQHLSWQYFNPVIYTNLFSYGLNNKNNLLTGLDARWKLSNKVTLYGQLMLDKLKSGTSPAGWGWQSGVNYFDVLGVKNLFLQAEYNDVSQGSYQNPTGSHTDQSYSHYNQTLAYTPGYGRELVLVGDYKYKRFFWNLRYNYQTIPQQGSISTLPYSYVTLINARFGYLINPSYNLNICVGMLYRTQNFSIFSTSNNETNYIYVGFRTSLYNLYYDF